MILSPWWLRIPMISEIAGINQCRLSLALLSMSFMCVYALSGLAHKSLIICFPPGQWCKKAWISPIWLLVHPTKDLNTGLVKVLKRCTFKLLADIDFQGQFFQCPFFFSMSLPCRDILKILICMSNDWHFHTHFSTLHAHRERQRYSGVCLIDSKSLLTVCTSCGSVCTSARWGQRYSNVSLFRIMICFTNWATAVIRQHWFRRVLDKNLA